MTKNYAIFAFVAIVLIAGGAVLLSKKPAENRDTLPVVASFYPLYFFASEIGGDKASVRVVVPAGTEPHEYEPTPQDRVAMERSKLLILNGAGFEGWGTDVTESLASEHVVIVSAGDDLATLAGPEEDEHGHEEEGEEDGHEEEAVDPHVWLSPILAAKMADRITDGFVAADSGNEAYYRANAEVLKRKLAELDTAYRAGLATCARRDIITSHAAFGYIADAYGLHQVTVTGVSPDEEPSVEQLAEVAEFAKANDVKYIFFETLVSPKLSETIANEVGAKTLMLNPLEGLSDEEMRAGEDYFTEMRSNLANLKIALECTP